MRGQLGSIPAVDGAALSEAEVARVYDAAQSRAAYHVPMQRGEIGCYLSHRAVWEKFLSDSRAPFAVVLEDDVAFEGRLAPLVAALAEARLPAWGMIKLWGGKRRVAREIARLTDDYRLVREAVLSKRTVGQIVSRAGAERLLAHSLPIRRPIDVQLQYPWEVGIDIFTISPSLVVDVGEELSGTSSTKTRADRFDAAKVEREARRALFRIGLVARSLTHFVAAALPAWSSAHE